MAVETWLAPTPRYDDPIVADSSDLQTAIEALLTLAGWTNTSPNVWQSADPSNWIEITFAQPASDKLSMVGLDYMGRAYPERRIGAVDAASQWDLYANPFGLCISGPADGKWFYGGVIDHFPKAMSSHVLDVIWLGALDNGDAASGDNMLQPIGPRYDGAVGQYSSGSYYATEINNTVPCMLYYGGPRRDAPWLIWANSASGRYALAGRVFHAVQVVSSFPAGSELIGIIDEGETGTFKVTRIPSHGSFPYQKIAMLKLKS